MNATVANAPLNSTPRNVVDCGMSSDGVPSQVSNVGAPRVPMSVMAMAMVVLIRMPVVTARRIAGRSPAP